MRRPSQYVLLCAVMVLATFSASGHLRVGRPASRPTPPVGVASVDAAPRDPELVRIRGSVLDTMGFRLVGAEVAVGDLHTQTDGDGQFRLDVPRAPVTMLMLRANGHRSRGLPTWVEAGEPVFAELEPSAPWDDGVEPLPPLPSVELFGEGCLRTRAGVPVAEAMVFVAETMAMARTDVAGRYRIALPATTATLIAHQPEGGRDGHGLCARGEPFAAPRSSGRVPLPDLVAGDGVALRGIVRDSAGQPQPGVPIQLVGGGFARTIASGEAGLFRIAGLLPGSYELRAFPFRGAPGASRAIELAAPTTDVDLQLRAATERRLQVVTSAGAPLARAIVAASTDGVRREVARSDEAGFVQMRAVDPPPQFEVRHGAAHERLRIVEAPEATGRLVVAAP